MKTWCMCVSVVYLLCCCCCVFVSTPHALHVIDFLHIIEYNVVRSTAGTGNIAALVDDCRLWKLSIRLQIPCFVCIVLQYDVPTLVLEITEADKHNVALVDPYLFPQLASNVAETCCTVKTLCLHPPVPKHLCHLSIFLAFLLEDQLSFIQFAVTLPTPPVFTSFACGIEEEEGNREKERKKEKEQGCNV